MRRQKILLTLSLFAALASPSAAQNFGEITGTVTDSSAAAINGATVTITNTATNQVRRLTTNEAGNYTLPYLVPGPYTVQAGAPNFKSAIQKDIDLQVGAVKRVDLSLQLGAVTESIEVTSASSQIASENAAIGTVIETKRIAELPLNGRDYLQLVKISPNVTFGMGASAEAAVRVGGDRAAESIAVAGQRIEFNYYTLDGVSNVDTTYNLFEVRPSIDALQEFKVLTGVFSAQYGRATSQVSVTTKPGSNEFHGTAFEFLRNSALDARNWNQTGSLKNPFRRNQYGFTLGGRLIRDKLFFMSNFESLRDRKTTQQLANVATTRMRAGDFGAVRTIFDPASRTFTTGASGNQLAVSATPFPNNVIPVTRFSPVALNLLQYYPTQTVPGDVIPNNFVRQVPAPTSWDQFTQRIDYNQNANSSWFGRFSWGDEFVRQLSVFPDQQGTIQTRTIQTVLSNTRILSPRIVNEARFGYSQFINDDLTYFSGTLDATGKLGIGGLSPELPIMWGVPSIGFTQGLTGFGDPVQEPTSVHNHTFQGVDNVSIIHGTHTIQFGGEIRRDRFNEIGDAFVRGSFSFAPTATSNPAAATTTGYDFADFMLGQINTAIQSSGRAQAQLRSTSTSLYVEDAWKIRPRLTMTLGLRHEYYQPWHDKYRGWMNAQMFDPGVGPNGLLPNTKTPILTRPGSGDFYQGMSFHFTDSIPTQAGDQYLGNALVASHALNFAPRLGLSYSPSDRLTVRAGWGMFFVRDTTEPRYDMARNLGGRETYNTNVNTPNSLLAAPFAAVPAVCSGWSGNCVAQPFVLSNNAAGQIPYVFQYVFNVQYQLDKNTVVEVGYQGSQGHRLEALRQWNEAVFRTGPGDSSTIVQRRPWGNAYAEINQLDNFVNSSYNAGSVKFQRRLSAGLTYLAAFTYSKSIDNASAIRFASGDIQEPISSYNPQGSRAASTFDVPRLFVTSVLYQLPVGPNHLFGRQMGPAAKILEGWQVGGILTLSDGSPLTVGYIGDPANVGNTGGQVPDATGISPIPANRSAQQFWNIQAFNATNPQLQYRFGNVGRNTLRQPGIRQFDFSLLKDTRIRERHTLQFRFEAFNFPNHPNWNPPPVNVLSPATFGVVTSARTMRDLQFSLKYIF